MYKVNGRYDFEDILHKVCVVTLRETSVVMLGISPYYFGENAVLCDQVTMLQLKKLKG
jgi:hypothetical protein